MSVQAAFFISPAAGDVYGTTFTYNNTTVSDSIKQYVWDFGDGNIEYNTATPQHIYKYPGVYTAHLTAYDTFGNISTTSGTVTADYAIRDYIAFSKFPDEFGTPGVLPSQSFQIYVQSAQIDQPIYVQLFADNSPSVPYSFKSNSKWNFLIPNWYFTDKDYNITEQILISTSPVFNAAGSTVGVSGFGTFYFKDDISIGNPVYNCPLVITATLQTSAFHVPIETINYSYPSYSNTTVTRATIAWQLYDYKPDYFKVTGNYIDEISLDKWINVPIPVMVTGATNQANRFCYTGVPQTSSGILFNFPSSNETGLLSQLNLSIIDTQTNQTVPTIPVTGVHFQKTDSNGFEVGGYIFTTITPLATANNAVIVAALSSFENAGLPEWEYPYAGGYGPTPIAWISNAENKNIAKILSMPYPDNCANIEHYKQNGTLIDTRIIETDTPYVSVTGSTYNYAMSGFSGIFSMSVFPGDQTMVAADAELNNLYKFSTTGKLLSTLQLSGITTYNPTTASVTPAYTSIDQCGNIWVTLFDSASVLKFDHNFNLLTVASPTGIDINTIFYGDDDHGDNLLKPAIVETDTFNNAWVTYSHPLCCLLVKYDSDGNVLYQTGIGNNSVPQALAVNKKNQLWVADSFNVTPNGGRIRLFDTDTTLLSTVTGFSRPSYMCLDQYNNVWFTHGVRNVGVLDRATASVSSWYIKPDAYYNTSFYNGDIMRAFLPLFGPLSANTLRIDIADNEYQNPELDPLFAARYDEELGGIAVDPYNRLWIIDSKTNNVLLLSAIPNFYEAKSRFFKIQPWTNIGYLNNVANTFTYAVTSPAYKSAQATGDWTGNRWFQKYANYTGVTTGSSNAFNIYSFNNGFELRRFNESFNTAEYYKSLALPEILSQNTNLFDNYITGMIGNGSDSLTAADIGKTIYERIANFTANHNDVDTCNVQQLLSLAQSVDVPTTVFGSVYPADIQNMLDIASIPRAKLWGLPDLAPLTAESIEQSRYYPLDPYTATVTAGTKIYLQSIFDSRYILTNVPTGPSGEVVYPLSSFPTYGLIEPVPLNYKFYQFMPVYSDSFIESSIDWNSPYTTINRTLSTADDLYKDGGIIESMFNYYLTKNLILN
jgi:hypothetical protein